MIEIIKAGMMSSIQDGGRYGYQDKGVSVSGVMDSLAYKVANILVGKEETAPCIEMAYAGPSIRFHQSMEISLTGAQFNPTINDVAVPMYETLYVQRGDVLACGLASHGIYGYLSFSASMEITKVLGSYATDIKTAIGGYEGRYLKTGDRIAFIPKKEISYLEKRTASKNLSFPYEETDTIRFTPGMEYERFAPSKNKDQRIEVEVTPVCSRMGYRLKGDNLNACGDGDIISEGLSLGTIQGTAGGEWIVMMADRQSVGGYARVGHVLTSDLVKLVHQRPGTKIYFKEVTVEEAQTAIRDLLGDLKEWKDSLSKPKLYSGSHRQQYQIGLNNKTFTVEVTAYKEAHHVL